MLASAPAAAARSGSESARSSSTANALARERDRRRDQFGEREFARAVALMRQRKSRDRAGHADGERRSRAISAGRLRPSRRGTCRAVVAAGARLAIVDRDSCPSRAPRWTTMKPPPPILPARGMVTASAKPTATAASTALPPRFQDHRRRLASACASWLATMPLARGGRLRRRDADRGRNVGRERFARSGVGATAASDSASHALRATAAA